MLVDELRRSVIFFTRANAQLKSKNEGLEQMLFAAKQQIEGRGGGNAAAAPQQQQQPPAAENQPQPEAQAQIQEPPPDPIVARALEMGMDPELVQSLPRDMIEELLQNNQMWADNLGNPPPNQAQPAEAEMGIADMITATVDPNLRREMLIQLSND